MVGAAAAPSHPEGHDLHVTALLGALATLHADTTWRGEILAVFQPAEEQGVGAQAMIDDGLARFGAPVVVDPAEFTGLGSATAIAQRVGELPSNRSPFYAAVIEPTIDLGAALTAAARAWLAPVEPTAGEAS